MRALADDENLNNAILRGLFRRRPELDIVRVQDAGPSGAYDPDVLEWVAAESWVLLTHDVSAISLYAHDRVCQGKIMSGDLQINQSAYVGRYNADILLLAELSLEGEWEGQVRYVPRK